ncbi:MAG TPA: SH3 domain-containing protein [Hypericibacter adhaerens]|jgi:uncharacterized protein YgiM (DUF1202 family)|uniref:SH3b domain-containing protein n=1 Tax=Hypericibacter adhaerens TaxID=2602016 RepID=A0A5J6MXZ5_9PROT|nr:SH3 domain-containing protein [Hypericibacter adhaerens]QEX22612.1 hypothetical protein FRZ61_25440 [Hypericibacter adhaerens]HWA41875.1 SH3 domain-containing protein [Hypericibacter adhaerens]
MRLLTPLAIAAVLGLLAAGTAQASPLPLPTPPGSSALVTVADVTMTVSNKEGYANLRQQPTSHSQLIEKLNAGTKVTVLGKAAGGKWYHVKVGDKEGYIARNLLK